MGKKAFYILKIIQEADGKAITGKEILKELERYGVFIDIKSVYSCVQRINDFFETWVDGKLIASIKKTGFTIKKELFLDGELQFILDSITFHEDLNDLDKLRLKAKLLQLSSTHQKKRLVDFIPQEKQIAFSLLMNLSTIMKAIANKQ
ncbi:MAG: WYL domain-containing protein, partial [Coprobacillus sp.]